MLEDTWALTVDEVGPGKPGVWAQGGPWLWLRTQTRAVSGSIMALVFGDDRLSLAAQAAAQLECY